MGSKKGPELPPTPTYQTDPIFKQGYENLFNYGNQLIKGDYSGFGGLQDATSLHPESTQLALQAAQGFLQPQYAQANLDATNAAAANNNLSSSTFTDALAKNAFNLQSQYQGIAANAGLQDAQQARQNKLSLFGTGLNTLNNATQFGFGNQNAQNQFNLENYQNEVAKALSEQKTPNAIGGIGSALGMGLGALLALPTGGMSLAAGAALGGAIGGGLGGGIDSYRGASGTAGFNAMGGNLGLLGSLSGGGNPSALRSTGSSYLPGMFAQNSLGNGSQLGFLKGLADAGIKLS